MIVCRYMIHSQQLRPLTSLDTVRRIMEAVGAIASIAGILSLTGQAMNGIIILRGFFQSCSSESHSIERFLKRLNDLIQILEHASDLVAKLRAAPSKIVPESILASLQIQLDDCNKDVYGWLATAKTYLPASNTGTKAAFKKFLVALERQRITDIYVEISAHKENILTKLSVIGRCVHYLCFRPSGNDFQLIQQDVLTLTNLLH